MKILLGTTNAAKAKMFEAQLAGYSVEICTLTDLGLQKHPDEDGKNPVENAMRKAAYYGKFHDPVITEDSALYIRELPLDDPRQPGLFVRRAPDGHEMDDEEMVAHYAALARSLGGRVTACWLDGYAVYKDSKVTGFMDDSEELGDVYAFYLMDKPHHRSHPGFPLDSLSVDVKTGLYLTDKAWGSQLTARERTVVQAYRQRLKEFYVQTLSLTKV